MKKKTLALVVATIMLVASFGACAPAGETGAGASPSGEVSTEPSGEVSTEPSGEAGGEPSGEAAEPVTFVIGASPVPHAEILKAAEEDLLAVGIKLEIKEFTDYIMPNTALESGDIDANFFQHEPYLEDFNQQNGTRIVSVLKIHFEPYGMYPGKLSTMDEMADGSTIAVPSDPTNEARALQLLEANGIITLREGAGLGATPMDIADNPKNVVIKELEAAMIPRAREDVDYVILNGNYAIEAGLNVDKDALIKEEKTSEGAGRFANILCVAEGNENSDAINKIKEVLTSDKMRTFIEEKYEGAVVPVF